MPLAVFRIRIRIGSGFNQFNGSGFTIRIRIQKGKNDHKNKKKFWNFMFWSGGCSLLKAESFSCSFDVLYGGKGISKLQFLIKNINYFFTCNFFHFLPVFGHQNPGSGSRSVFRLNAGSGSGFNKLTGKLNQCGYETLTTVPGHVISTVPVLLWIRYGTSDDVTWHRVKISKF